MQKKISVCMATYNGQKFVKQQLDSILSQLGDNDEVIISDDGSTDRTIDIINGFKDNRIKVYHCSFRNPLQNFENAIIKSTGEYIFLSDQDDIWETNKVISMCELLNSYDLVVSDCRVVDENLITIYPSYFKLRNSKSGFFSNIYKNAYLGCCMAFNRKIFKYILPFPTKIHMHDWWIGLVTDLYGNTFFYEESLVLYRRHGNNASPTTESSFSLKIKIKNRLMFLYNIFLLIFKIQFIKNKDYDFGHKQN